MPTRKLSVSLDPTVAEAVKAAAEQRGMTVSAWMNEASRNALAIQKGLVAVAEYEAEHGAFTAAEIAATDAMLDAAGVPRLRW